MKFSAALVVLASSAFAAEFSASQYAEGEVHQQLMDMKNAHWDEEAAQGILDPARYASLSKSSKHKNDVVRCKDGLAVVEEGNPMQTFRCQNMDLYDFLNHADMGDAQGQGSSSWGWRDRRSGREFGIVGQFNGAAFVEVLRNGKMVYMGRLPAQSVGSRWREIRVLNDFVIIGSEAVGHNVQIFDMKKVLDIDPRNPKTFNPLTDLEGLFIDDLPIGRTHNIVVDWDNNYAIAVGAQPRNSTCKSGLQYIDLSDSSKPVSPGCASQDGYVHDAQCVTYRGPDRRYRGRNICIGYNEDTVTIYDSTKKDGNPASEVISRMSYDGASYTHQGWWTDDSHEIIIFNDELDEVRKVGPGASGRPVTHIADLRDLQNPKPTGTFFSCDHKAIDHNLYVVDGLAYQSNYGAGLWVHDIRSLRRDPSGAGVTPHAFFDVHPESDAAGGEVVFTGTWSHFLFPSGYILVNTIERGAFITKIARGRGSHRGDGFPVQGRR